MNHSIAIKTLALCAALAGAGSAWSQAGHPAHAAATTATATTAAPAVEVRDAWVRQSVPGQSGTGAFMKLTAPAGARLVGISTPAAGVAEVHEMKMDGDTMRMRALPALELPAGKTVELKSGGHHLMLMDLKKPLVKGTTVPLTLRFEDAKGASTSLELSLPVGAPAGPAAAPGHGHKH